MAKRSSGKGDRTSAPKEIDTVHEEEDYNNSSHLPSDAGASSPKDASHQSPSQVDNSGELRESAPSPPKEEASELEDKEVFESTDSVDWQVVLQQRQQAVPEEPSELDEQIEERSDLEGDALGDLESFPSGSMGLKSRVEDSSAGDFDMRVDQITDELLN